MANFEAATAKGSNPKVKGEDTQPPPTLHLGEEHLKKFGIKKMPAVGTKLKFHAVAHVGATSENQDHGDGGKHRSMTLHIHKMDMGAGHQSSEVDEESQKAGMKSAIDKSLTKQESKD